MVIVEVKIKISFPKFGGVKIFVAVINRAAEMLSFPKILGTESSCATSRIFATNALFR